MKKLCLAAFLLLVITAGAQSVRLHGLITHPVSSNVKVVVSVSPISDAQDTYAATLDASGRFQMDIPLEVPSRVVFIHGNERATLFLHPGDSLKLSLDTEAFDETLRFIGKTPGVADCRFLAAYFLRFEDEAPSVSAFNQIKDLQPAAYTTWRRQLQAAQIAFLDSANKKMPLSKAFFQFQSQEIRYASLLDLENYPDYHAYLNGKQAPDPLPASYYQYRELVSLPDDAALANPSYIGYLYAFLSSQVSDQSDLESMVRARLLAAEKSLSGQSLAAMKGMFLLEAISQGAAEAFRPDIDAFLQTYGHRPYGKAVAAKREKMAGLQTGKPAPAFTLVDFIGDSVAMQDLRGKVVYLDFWASWCGPCRAEMPASRELQAKFTGQDVVFVYISIDQSEAAWRKGMESLQMTGALLWTGGPQHPLLEAYQINGIPHYILIDRQGRLLDYQAPRPSSGEKIESAIQAALNRPYKAGAY